MFAQSDIAKHHYTPGGVAEFLILATPLVVSNLSLSIMNFVDRLFLSWSSPEEVAASVPAGILAFAVSALFLGVCEYTNTFVAQFNGANRPAEIGLATWQGIYCALLSAVIILVCIPFGPAFFNWVGHDEIVRQYEIEYFTWIMLSMIFMVLNAALSSFYSGRGKTKVIMIISIIGNTLNGILDYALIFGVWGFPEWGIKGAGIATTIAQALMSLTYLTLFLSAGNHQRYQTRSTYHFNPGLFKRLFYFGMPSGMVFFLEVTGFTVFIMFIGQLGTVELAATNIVISLNMLAFFPMMGAQIAVSTAVGQYIGKNDHDTAQKSTFSAFLCVETYMLAFALLYYCFPEQLMYLFHSHDTETGLSFDEIAQTGANILFCVAIYQIFDAMILTFSGALRGAGDTIFAMWTAAIFMWFLFVPGTWVVLYVLDLGVFYAWAWAVVYLGIMGSIYWVRFQSGYWRTIQVIPEEPIPHTHLVDV